MSSFLLSSWASSSSAFCSSSFLFSFLFSLKTFMCLRLNKSRFLLFLYLCLFIFLRRILRMPLNLLHCKVLVFCVSSPIVSSCVSWSLMIVLMILEWCGKINSPILSFGISGNIASHPGFPSGKTLPSLVMFRIYEFGLWSKKGTVANRGKLLVKYASLLFTNGADVPVPKSENT